MRRVVDKIKDTNPCTAFGLVVFSTAFYYAQKPILKCAEYFEKVRELI